MTGMLYVSDKRSIKELNTKHEIVRLQDKEGRILSYTDARKFGLIDLVHVNEWPDYQASLRLGLEPLIDEFLDSNVKSLLKQSKRPIKDWLLDQSLIAGLGNIYASEVCFALRLHPMQTSGSPAVTRKSKRLKIAVQTLLRKAVTLGGSNSRE
jgi:formamidopyrimidine-DNA glycosylase